jgi:hypothetical protein
MAGYSSIGVVTTRARLRFTGILSIKPWRFRRASNYHRTAGSVLTVCVSRGDKRNPNLPEPSAGGLNIDTKYVYN